MAIWKTRGDAHHVDALSKLYSYIFLLTMSIKIIAINQIKIDIIKSQVKEDRSLTST